MTVTAIWMTLQMMLYPTDSGTCTCATRSAARRNGCAQFPGWRTSCSAYLPSLSARSYRVWPS